MKMRNKILKIFRLVVIFMSSSIMMGYFLHSKELIRSWLSPEFAGCSFQAALMILLLALCGLLQERDK